MPRYLISYDLKSSDPSPHRPMLAAAEKEGLLYVVKGTDLHRLPNTTLWGVFATGEAASRAFNRALAATASAIGRKVTLEKRIVAKIGDCNVLSDKRKVPETRWTGQTSFETCRLHQLNDPFFK